MIQTGRAAADEHFGGAAAVVNRRGLISKFTFDVSAEQIERLGVIALGQALEGGDLDADVAVAQRVAQISFGRCGAIVDLPESSENPVANGELLVIE